MSRATLLTTMGGVLLAATLATGVGWVAAQPGQKPAGGSERPAPAVANPGAEQPAPPPKPARPDPIEARRAVEDKIVKLEQYAEGLKTEIDAMEKQIELLSRANGFEDNQRAIRYKQVVEVEEEYRRQNREISKLEAELVVLKRRLDDKNRPEPDPILIQVEVNNDADVVPARIAVREAKKALEQAVLVSGPSETQLVKELRVRFARAEKEYEGAVKVATENAMSAAPDKAKLAARQRIAKLATELDIQKEIREKLKEEVAITKKILDQMSITLNIPEMRKMMDPQREVLSRVQRELALLRLQRTGVTLTEANGTDAKLDAVLRELAALRKDVQELKELNKK